jgi:hypothetical protein
MFASTIGITKNDEVLKLLSKKVQNISKEKEERGEKPFVPPGLDNKPDEPGKPDDPGKPDEPGKPDNPGKPDDPGKSDESGKPDNVS